MMVLAYLRNELLKRFGKKRTYIGFGAFLLAQNAMLLLLQLGPVKRRMEGLLSGNGYLAQEYISALTVALFMILPQIVMFMPLYATLVGGDLVAKEAEDGTLRMILSRPISRFQLLFAKGLAGAIFSALLVPVAQHVCVPAGRLVQCSNCSRRTAALFVLTHFYRD